MPILCRLVLVVGGAGLLAGLPWSGARACDGDRFPCPVVVEAPAQEPAVSTRPKRKKASQAARQEQKSRAKPERSAPRAVDGPKESKPAGHGQAADSTPRQAVEAARVMAASSLADRWAGEDGPGGNRLATAEPGGSVGTETDAVVVRTSRVDGVAPTEAEANAVQLVELEGGQRDRSDRHRAGVVLERLSAAACRCCTRCGIGGVPASASDPAGGRSCRVGAGEHRRSEGKGRAPPSPQRVGG